MPLARILPALLALAAALWPPAAAAAAAGGRGYGGESCAACHAGLSEERPSAPKASESADVVIVGGGMAGLSALHHLKGVDAVLLEAEPEAGGQMRMDTWKGLSFAKGAAYFVQPSGILKPFYEEAGIPLVKIPAPDNSAWMDGVHYPDCWTKEGRGHMPWKGAELEAWLRFLEFVDRRSAAKSAGALRVDEVDPEMARLDEVTALEYMRSAGLSQAQIEHFDLYIPSCLGGKSDKVSAAAFIDYLSDELGRTYTLEGGLGASTSILYRNMKPRIRLNSLAVAVAQDQDGASVVYRRGPGRGARWRGLRAKAVILAIPADLWPGIVKDLPAEKLDVIKRTERAAYAVAAVLCNEAFWDDKGYDTWIPGMVFKDIIDADWISRGGKPRADKKRPHVLSLYIPLGPDMIGKLMVMDQSRLKRRILDDLEKLVPGSRAKVAGVRIYRYGHSMHVAAPGFLTKSAPVLRKPHGRLFFAGVETDGLPNNEAAVLSGYAAAQDVRAFLGLPAAQPPAAPAPLAPAAAPGASATPPAAPAAVEGAPTAAPAGQGGQFRQ